MPILNKRERVEAIMRYLHEHVSERNTIDHLAKSLDIPFATMSKTLRVDYPECFTRDSTDRRVITLTGIWPDSRAFDLEPRESASGELVKLKALHMRDIDTDLVSEKLTNLFIESAKNPITTGKPSHEYYQALNTMRYMEMMLRVLRSPEPRKKLAELVDDPSRLPDMVEQLVAIMEASIKMGRHKAS